MSYLDCELKKDIEYTKRRYDADVITFEQMQTEFIGYITIVKNIDEDMAKDLARGLGVNYNLVE